MPLNGLSWMDYVAQHGWDVYIMDLRGYGRSTRPPQMSKPAAKNPPIVNTNVAAKDVSAVVDHILVRRGVPRINLVGWSWGTTIMGAYTAQNNSKVERLALCPRLSQKTLEKYPSQGQMALAFYFQVVADYIQ